MPSPPHLAALLGSRFNPFTLPNTAAAYDYDDFASLIYNGSNQILVTSDKSGNSATNGLVLNGVTGNDATSPNSVPTTITGDVSIVMCVQPVSITQASITVMTAQGATGDYNWEFYWNTSGTLGFLYSVNGSAVVAKSSTATLGSVGITAFQKIYVGVYQAVDNGASGNSIFFYWSLDGVTWTQLGNTVTTAGTITRKASAGPVRTGSQTGGGAVFNGIIFRSTLYSGNYFASTGIVVYDPDFTRLSKLVTSFTEFSSNAATVTINQSGDAGARICGARDIYQNTLGKCSVLSNVNGYWQAAQDGSNDFSKSARFPLAQPLSLYWVGTMTSWTANDIILDGGANDTMELFQDTSTPRISGYAGGTLGPLTQFTVGQKHVLGMVLNGANSFAAVDLNAIITGNAGTATPNGITLGAQASGSSNANIATNKLLIRSVADDPAMFTRIMRDLVRRNAVS